ncbi:MAG: hypothetical protein U1F71_09880 [Verrucomicrobiaceae bacterium]
MTHDSESQVWRGDVCTFEDVSITVPVRNAPEVETNPEYHGVM